MYVNKDNVNILTALLVSHGVRHAVVCPGSRNAPIVHNLNECPSITCYPVTDERSAGFYALGISQAICAPVVVCVTSGTALLNLSPAVAEASYQHIPLIVVSADRPSAWIEQLDGQTIPQANALGKFVGKAVNLPEPKNEIEHWHCNRMINEALLEACHRSFKPVHINVPISEPLFEFNISELPKERSIIRINPATHDYYADKVAENFVSASRPMLVIGQMVTQNLIEEDMKAVGNYAVVLREALSPHFGDIPHFDEVISNIGNDDAYLPDFILYLGDTLISKRLKEFLRRADKAEQWRVSENGDIHDTFMNLSGVIEGSATDVVGAIADKINGNTTEYRKLWHKALKKAASHASDFKPDYSQMLAVSMFENGLEDCIVHYANSISVRLGNIYARHYIFCNRGTNGIEGSLSTAAGFSLLCEKRVYHVTGDLSFFYDQNALCNEMLRDNLRIMLLNNGCGGIFRQIGGLKESPALDKFISGAHGKSARGICEAYDIKYISATNKAELEASMNEFLNGKCPRPMLLEVFTNPDEDDRVLKEYYNILKL